MAELVYVSRAEWGATQATELYIAGRPKATPAEKTTIQVHHSASIDDDLTKNRWSYEDAQRYMRSLQTARPELGPLPYSLCLAVSEDAETVWIFEGRGILPVGAHTAGHNRDGLGYGIFGNFDLRDDVAALRAVHAIELDVAKRRREGLVNLGSVKNPKGWNAWGHRDSSAKSCPGNHVYPLLSQFELDKEEDDMQIPEAHANTLKYLHEAFEGNIGSTREQILDQLIADSKSDIITRSELTAAINAALATAGDGSSAEKVLAELVKRITNG